MFNLLSSIANKKSVNKKHVTTYHKYSQRVSTSFHFLLLQFINATFLLLLHINPQSNYSHVYEVGSAKFIVK